MRKMRNGLIFLFFVSYASSVVSMSKIREFVRELCKGAQIKRRFANSLSSPDDIDTKRIYDQLLDRIGHKKAQKFMKIFDQEFLNAYLDIDYRDFLESDLE